MSQRRFPGPSDLRCICFRPRIHEYQATDALRGTLLSVRAMLDVLGLDPLVRPWAGGAETTGLTEVVDGLVAVALEERAAARARKDFPAADRIRDGLVAAGVLVEDTPAGPRWTLEEKD